MTEVVKMLGQCEESNFQLVVSDIGMQQKWMYI